ncbi:hypothetical protein HDU67_006215 [Dinochytrium kinnereticum]|nr:hypothetical protein HDU67_006215 [Dinochytrium kinnereticum]
MLATIAPISLVSRKRRRTISKLFLITAIAFCLFLLYRVNWRSSVKYADDAEARREDSPNDGYGKQPNFRILLPPAGEDAAVDEKGTKAQEQAKIASSPAEDGICGNLSDNSSADFWGVGISWECGRMPRMIHQISDDSVGALARDTVAKWRSSWKDNHPTYFYKLWTYEEIQRVVNLHYRHLIPTFKALKSIPKHATSSNATLPGTQTISIISALLLVHHFGGIYAGNELECLKSMDQLVESKWKRSGLEPGGAAIVSGVFNNKAEAEGLIDSDDGIPSMWMAGVPQHPFFAMALEYIREIVDRMSQAKEYDDFSPLDTFVTSNRFLHYSFELYLNRTDERRPRVSVLESGGYP